MDGFNLLSQVKCVPLTIHDPRWMAGIQECGFQENVDDVEEYEKYDPFQGLENKVICSSCKHTIGVDPEREAILSHYTSQWHKFNVKRITCGKKPLAEEDFEDTIEEDESNTSDTDEEDESIGFNFQTGSSAFFVQNGMVYSIYRAILYENEKRPSQEVFIRPINCAIFLLAGGHFAAAVFKNDKMMVHKTIKRYVIRAKQGKAQSLSDASGVASSAGSSLRRHNERRLREEVVDIITSFKKEIAECPLIFIRCASYQKSTFYVQGILEKNDPRIRNIPFATKRPSLGEVRNIWERTHLVSQHGSIEDFEKQLDILKKQHASRKNLQKKKKETFLEIIDEDKQRNPEEKKKDHIKIRQEEQKEDSWPKISRNIRAKLYETIVGNDIDGLKSVIDQTEDLNEVLKYLNEKRFDPNSFAFLHIASSKGLDDVLQYLLELHCDPAAQDDEGRVPFALAYNKKTKSVFINFREDNPTLWSYGRTHIPEVKELTEEQKAKQEEKKREKKQKQKEKKAQAKEEAEEQNAKQAFLNLSEREKRAMAAEARLGTLSRCVNCGSSLPSIPFEYNDLKLCSPACVASHRSRCTEGPKI